MFRTKNEVDRHVQDVLQKLKNNNEKNLRCFNFAKLYYQVKDYESARRYIQSFLSVRQDSANGQKLLGQVLEALGHKEQALEAYKCALELDGKQTDLVLKVCELLVDGDMVDVGRARYWCDRAQQQHPHHPAVFRLKEHLLNSEGADGAELEALIAAELAARPRDVSLHTRLLRLYLDTRTPAEAWRRAMEVEARAPFRHELTWYSCLADVCQAYASVPGNAASWEFLSQQLSVRERVAALSLEDRGRRDGGSAVRELDRALARAVPHAPAGDLLLGHMAAQLCLHLACLSLRRAQRGGDWRDACRSAAPLLLLAMDGPTPAHPEPTWAPDAALRWSQAGHTLLGMVRGRPQQLLERVSQSCCDGWRERTFQKLFGIRESREESYFLATDALSSPRLRLPTPSELSLHDERAQATRPESLELLVWLGLRALPRGLGPNFRCCVMERLQLFCNNPGVAGPETLSLLDADAFLYCCVLCAGCVTPQEDDERPNVLPVALTAPLCSPEQAAWWDAAVLVYEGRANSDLGHMRQVLRRGLETVRALGSHGLDARLLVHLARCFTERAAALSARTKQAPEVVPLEARASLYWSVVLPMLERQQRGQATQTSRTRLFDYCGKEMTAAEVSTCVEDGRFFLACQLVKEDKLEEAIEAFERLKSPYASFHEAQIYQKLAEQKFGDERGEMITSEMRSQHIILLTKARECLYLTLDRLRDPKVDRKHPLNAELSAYIADIETQLRRIDPDMCRNDVNQNECDGMSDDSVSSMRSGGDNLNSVGGFLTPHHRSGLKHSSTPYRTKVDASEGNKYQRRTEARPSPERLDAQIRQLAYSQDAGLQAILEAVRGLGEEQRGLAGGLRSVQEEVGSLRRAQEELKGGQHVREDTSSLRCLQEELGGLRNAQEDLRREMQELRRELKGRRDIGQVPSTTEEEPYHLEEEDYPDESGMAQQLGQYPPFPYPSYRNMFLAPHDATANPALSPFFRAVEPAMVYPAPLAGPYYGGTALPFSEGQQLPDFRPAPPRQPNVVVTASERLPTSVPGSLPPLSVTIPPQHRLGAPHAFQISMPPQAQPVAPVLPAPAPVLPVATTTLLSSVPSPQYSAVSVVGSSMPPREASSESEGEEPERDPCPDFKPVIPLPAEVTVTTGEEEETVLFSGRAKLFRYVEREWKERGVGTVKLLRHEARGSVRLLMRREQVHKVCANHALTSDMHLVPMTDRAWIWVAHDFADEEMRVEKLCIRFKTNDEALAFHDAFDAARKSLKPNTAATTVTDVTSTVTLPPSVTVPLTSASPAVTAAITPLKPATLFTVAAPMNVSSATVVVTSISAASTYTSPNMVRASAAGTSAAPVPAASVPSKTTAKTTSTNAVKPVMSAVEEEVLFSGPATLLRWQSGAWHDTVSGDARLLYRASSHQALFSLRQGATTLAEHVLEASSELNSPSERAWSWDVSPGPQGEGQDHVCVRLVSHPDADKFHAAFGRAKHLLGPKFSVGGFTFASTPTLRADKQQLAPQAASTPQDRSQSQEKVTAKPSPFAGFSFKSAGMVSLSSVPENPPLRRPHSALPTVTTAAETVVTSPQPVVVKPIPIPDDKPMFAPVTGVAAFSEISGGPGFRKDASFKGWEGAGSSVFGASDEASDDFVPTAEFKPVIPLPELVEVVTGEEGEEVLWEERAKLLRFDRDAKQWKERGVGRLKLLRHPETGRVRLLMRREQVFKVCCNHFVTAKMVLRELPSSDRAWSWVAQDYSEGELQTEMLAARFKTAEQAQLFKDAVSAAQADAARPTVWKCAECLFPNASDASQCRSCGRRRPADRCDSPSRPPAEECRLSVLKPLSEFSKHPPGSWECSACYIRNKESDTQCVACETLKPCSKPVTAHQNGPSLAEAFRPPSGSWECASCYLRNKATDTKCAACETARSAPSAPQEGQQSLADMFRPMAGSWECRDCYTRNGCSARACVCCGAAQPTASASDIKSPTTKAPTTNSSVASQFTFGVPPSSTPAVATPPASSTQFVFGVSSSTVGQPTQFQFGAPPTTSTTSESKPTQFVFGIPTTTSSTEAKPAGFTFDSKTAVPAFQFGLSTAAGEKAVTKSTPFSFGASSESSTLAADKAHQFTFGSPEKFEFSFSGIRAGRSPGKSPRSPESEDDATASEGEEDGPVFTPVVPLPDKVPVVTGEEDEEVRYCQRAKLFRWVAGEWKERGIGDVKILRQRNPLRARIVMRRDVVLKLCLNHLLTPELQLLAKDDRTWLWSAADFSEGHMTPEQFALRFKTSEIATEFHAAFISAQAELRRDKPSSSASVEPDVAQQQTAQDGSASPTYSISPAMKSFKFVSDSKDSSPSPKKTIESKGVVRSLFGGTSYHPKEDECQIVFELEVSPEERAAALQLQLPANFYAYRRRPPCPGCVGCEQDGEGKSPSQEAPLLTSLLKPSLGTSTQAAGATPPVSTQQHTSLSSAPVSEQPPASFTPSLYSLLQSAASTKTQPRTATTSASPTFGQLLTSVSTPPVFEQPQKTIATSSVFEGSQTHTSSTPHFGQQTSTVTSTIFGQPQTTTAASTIFGQPQTSAATLPIFGQSQTSTSTSTSFGQPQVGTPVFGQLQKPTSAIPLFGNETSTTTTSIFGQPKVSSSATPTFGQPQTCTATTTVLGQSQTSTFTTPVFGHVQSSTSASLFAQPKTISPSAPTENTPSGISQPKTSLFGESQPGARPFSFSLDSGTPFLPVENSQTFASLANQAAPSAFSARPVKDFTWQGSGSNLFCSPARADDSSGEEGEVDSSHDPHFEPVIALPEAIEVRTGEEDEVKVFGQRAKLYRYDIDTKEWKERGVGEMKVLHHPERGTYRLLLRREQVHKVVLNHLVSADLDLKPMSTSETAWCWCAMNHAEEPSLEKLAVRFKGGDAAHEFRERVREAVQSLSAQQQSSATTSEQIVSTAPEIEKSTHKPEDDHGGGGDTGDGDDKEEEDYDDDDDDDDDEDDDDDKEEDNYVDDEEDGEPMVVFSKRTQLSVQEANGTWRILGMGDLRIEYDADFFGFRIHVQRDGDSGLLCNSVIAMNTSLEVNGQDCVWNGLDYSSEPSIHRTFRARFSSKEAAGEFQDMFRDGKELAAQSEIIEHSPPSPQQ